MTVAIAAAAALLALLALAEARLRALFHRVPERLLWTTC